MKKAIAQEDFLGCGIACVAFITGDSYKMAKRKYFRNGNDAHRFGYLCKDLVSALAAGKREYSYRYIKKRASFKAGTIVFVKRSKRYPSGHYLVRTDGGWMDPWINFCSGRIEIKNARSGFRKRLPGRPIYAVFAAPSGA